MPKDDGKLSPIRMTSPLSTQEEVIATANCPICFIECKGLAELNKHLDKDHNFGLKNNGTSPQKKTSKEVENSNDKNSKKSTKIKSSHWDRFEKGKTSCFECGKLLNNNTSVVNCGHCGHLFCQKHCSYDVKLNKRARYDALKGLWMKACHNCYIQSPGYNDLGKYHDKTEEFSELRSKKLEDRNLRSLQIESRLVRLLNGMIYIAREYGDNALVTILRNNDISKFEITVVPWKDSSMIKNCSICTRPFGFLNLSRKHHCRLCGIVICDSDYSEVNEIIERQRLTTRKKCSYQISIGNLRESTEDLPYEFKLDHDELYLKEIPVRICSICVDVILLKRKFYRDITKPLSLLLQKYETLTNLASVIRNILPRFQESLKGIDDDKDKRISAVSDIRNLTKLRVKLLRSFSNYNVLTKEIMAIKPANISEQRIQKSVQIESSFFINEYILPLRSLPAVLQGDNYDMNKNEPEVKKLSDLVYNGLSIKEVKEYREELMVLKEQIFQIDQLIQSSKKQRKFDEVAMLTNNLNDLNNRVSDLESKLGEEGFQ
ncbi:Vacuolar segregation protein PEP7 [Nakaseomyces bracarensis]|uniref:Vacuolar segregation protein PEP7 n=1 Tax=Nakaseomyces bracarensis TaxID=273131 RepID=A0ABR4NYG4_9SACH